MERVKVEKRERKREEEGERWRERGRFKSFDGSLRYAHETASTVQHTTVDIT